MAAGDWEHGGGGDDGAMPQLVHPEHEEVEGADAADGRRWAVEQLLKRRVCRGGRTEYLVRWCGDFRDSWEAAADVGADLAGAFDAAGAAAAEQRSLQAQRDLPWALPGALGRLRWTDGQLYGVRVVSLDGGGVLVEYVGGADDGCITELTHAEALARLTPQQQQ